MAEVFIAYAEADEGRARALAAALTSLGFETQCGLPAPPMREDGTVSDEKPDVRALFDASKAVLAVWSSAAAIAPTLSFEATLALERKKLTGVAFERDVTPAPFRAAPLADLATRDRVKFKTAFAGLVQELEKLTEKTGKPDALPGAIADLRAALAKPGEKKSMRGPMIALALSIAFLFVVGFGAGRLINAARVGPAPLVEAQSAEAASLPTQAGLLNAGDAPWSNRLVAGDASTPRYGVSLADLETLAWRDAAAKIAADQQERIESDAQRGDAYAQTIACLGHMAGAGGFMPSPAAARGFCDAGSEQRHPAALYLSWMLRKTDAIDQTTARARLEAAAAQGWSAAQVEYASVLAPDFNAPVPAQVEAGRLWLAAAEHGDPRGQYQYARWLRDSRAGPRDPAQAAPYLEHASQKGDLEATHMLATLYRDGQGVAHDLTRARSLYERAAQKQYAPSMFNLADLLRRGGEPDRARAIGLYQSLACTRDQVQISAMAAQRLRELGQPRPPC